MAIPAATFAGIRRQLRAGTPAPLYILHGEEGYYLDELVKEFEGLVPEGERDFNLFTLYAPEVTPAQVIDAAMRYPFMSDRQVVILKELQSVRADFIEHLLPVVEHPNGSSVFVAVSRGAKMRGAKFMKAAAASGAVLFESRKLYENQVAPVIARAIADAGMSIDPKAQAMMVEHVGTDLSRIMNEVNKVVTALHPGAAVTPQVVEQLIGISKDYNNFELVDALVRRDAARAYRIADYFKKNPKNNPAIPAGAIIFNMYAKILMGHYAAERTEAGVAAAIGSRPGAPEVKRVVGAMRMYNARQAIVAISACRRFDARAKGIGSRANEHDLLRELIFTILN